MIGGNNSNLNFQANLEDNVSPQADAIERRLRAMGANEHEIKITLKAYDQASQQAQKVKAQLAQIPQVTTVQIRANTDHFHRAMDSMKRTAEKPMYATVHVKDNIDEHMAKLRQKYQDFADSLKHPLERYPGMGKAAPITGQIVGNLAQAAQIPGVGQVAGAAGSGLGAVAIGGAAAYGAADFMKQSIQLNAEREQQMIVLRQTLKDRTAAGGEMRDVTQFAMKTPFNFSDVLQSDVRLRQYGLNPNDKLGMKRASEMASGMGTDLGTATEAIAEGKQGYFARLNQNYGVNIKQEDFQSGGKYQGKSYTEAMLKATERFVGASEMQAKSFKGVVSNIQDIAQNKIVIPLGQQTFQGVRGAAQNVMGQMNDPGGNFQKNLGKFIAEAQVASVKFFDTLKQGSTLFKTHLQTPLAEITKSMISLGKVFGQTFGGLMKTGLTSVAEAFTSIIAPVGQLVANSGLGKVVIQLTAVGKALQMLGATDEAAVFGDLAKSLNPLTFSLSGVIKNSAHLATLLPKAFGAIVVKNILDITAASRALDNEFKALDKNGASALDALHTKASFLALSLGKSGAEVKNIMASFAAQTPTNLTTFSDKELRKKAKERGVSVDEYKAEYKGNVALSFAKEAERYTTTDKKRLGIEAPFGLGFMGINLPSRLGMGGAGLGKEAIPLALQQAMANVKGKGFSLNSDNNSPEVQKAFSQVWIAAKEVSEALGVDLKAATKKLSESFGVFGEQIQSMKGNMSQNAAMATAMDSSLQKTGLTASQTAKYQNSQGLTKAVLDQMASPSAALIGKISKSGGKITDYWNTYSSNEAAARDRADRGGMSYKKELQPINEAKDRLRTLRSDLTQGPRQDIQNRNMVQGIAGIGVSLPKLPDLSSMAPNLAAMGNNMSSLDGMMKQVERMNGIIDDYSKAIERATQAQAKQQRVLSLVSQAQADVSNQQTQYAHNTLTPMQRQIEDLNINLSKSAAKLDDISFATQKADYNMQKFGAGLFTGEQAALDNIHALDIYTKKLHQLELQTTGMQANLTGKAFHSGFQATVAPIMGFSLQRQQQLVAIQRDKAQTDYDLDYGEKHYQLQKASRGVFERTEMSFEDRMKGVGDAVKVKDRGTIKTRDLLDKMRPTQVQVRDLGIKFSEAALKGRDFEDASYRLGQAAYEANKKLTTLNMTVGTLQDSLASVRGGREDVMKIITDRLKGMDPAKARKFIKEYGEALGLTPTQIKEINGSFAKLEKARKKAGKAPDFSALGRAFNALENLIKHPISSIMTLIDGLHSAFKGLTGNDITAGILTVGTVFAGLNTSRILSSRGIGRVLGGKAPPSVTGGEVIESIASAGAVGKDGKTIRDKDGNIAPAYGPFTESQMSEEQKRLQRKANKAALADVNNRSVAGRLYRRGIPGIGSFFQQGGEEARRNYPWKRLARPTYGPKIGALNFGFAGLGGLIAGAPGAIAGGALGSFISPKIAESVRFRKELRDLVFGDGEGSTRNKVKNKIAGVDERLGIKAKAKSGRDKIRSGSGAALDALGGFGAPYIDRAKEKTPDSVRKGAAKARKKVKQVGNAGLWLGSQVAPGYVEELKQRREGAQAGESTRSLARRAPGMAVRAPFKAAGWAASAPFKAAGALRRAGQEDGIKGKAARGLGKGAALAGAGTAIAALGSGGDLKASSIAAGIGSAAMMTGTPVGMAVGMAATLAGPLLDKVPWDKIGEKLMKFLKTLWPDMTKDLKQVGEFFRKAWHDIQPAMEAIGNALKKAGGAFIKGLSWLMGNVIKPGLELFGKFVMNILIPALKIYIKMIITEVKVIIAIIRWVVIAIIDSVKWIVTAIMDVAKFFWNAGKWVGRAIKGAAEGVKNAFKTAARWLKGAFKTVVGWLKGGFKTVIGWFKSAGKWIKDALHDAWTGIKKSAKWVYDKLRSAGQWIADKFGWVIDKIGKVLGFVGDLPGTIWSGLKKLPGLLIGMMVDVLAWLASQLPFGIGDGLAKDLRKSKTQIAGNFANGGMIQGDPHKIGPGKLIRVVEEGYPEMIIPLAPHRRERARELMKQTLGMMGGPKLKGLSGGYAKGFMDGGMIPGYAGGGYVAKSETTADKAMQQLFDGIKTSVQAGLEGFGAAQGNRFKATVESAAKVVKTRFDDGSKLAKTRLELGGLNARGSLVAGGNNAQGSLKTGGNDAEKSLKAGGNDAEKSLKAGGTGAKKKISEAKITVPNFVKAFKDTFNRDIIDVHNKGKAKKDQWPHLANGGLAQGDPHKVGPGKLAWLNEEGHDEMVIPLAPHRRERARSLVAQTLSRIGGFANGGFSFGGTYNSESSGAYLAGITDNLRRQAFQVGAIDLPGLPKNVWAASKALQDQYDYYDQHDYKPNLDGVIKMAAGIAKSITAKAKKKGTSKAEAGRLKGWANWISEYSLSNADLKAQRKTMKKIAGSAGWLPTIDKIIAKNTRRKDIVKTKEFLRRQLNSISLSSANQQVRALELYTQHPNIGAKLLDKNDPLYLGAEAAQGWNLPWTDASAWLRDDSIRLNSVYTAPNLGGKSFQAITSPRQATAASTNRLLRKQNDILSDQTGILKDIWASKPVEVNVHQNISGAKVNTLTTTVPTRSR